MVLRAVRAGSARRRSTPSGGGRRPWRASAAAVGREWRRAAPEAPRPFGSTPLVEPAPTTSPEAAPGADGAPVSDAAPGGPGAGPAADARAGTRATCAPSPARCADPAMRGSRVALAAPDRAQLKALRLSLDRSGHRPPVGDGAPPGTVAAVERGDRARRRPPTAARPTVSRNRRSCDTTSIVAGVSIRNDSIASRATTSRWLVGSSRR